MSELHPSCRPRDTFPEKLADWGGFYGEQGEESLHVIFNKKKKRYISIKKDTNRLTPRQGSSEKVIRKRKGTSKGSKKNNWGLLYVFYYL